MNSPIIWSDPTPSFRLDVISLAFALLLHSPLLFMKFDAKKETKLRDSERLVSIDLLDAVPTPPPVRVAPPPPKDNLMSKLQKLVRNDPPPPPPPKVEKVPEKLDTGPKKIELQPNLKLPEKIEPKLATKSGFKTDADPKLVEDKKIALKALTPGIAPLSAKKLGTIENRESLKTDKGGFKVATGEKLASIGSGPAGLSDPSAPAISIRAGAKGTTEKFTAPPPQKSDKGRIGAVGAPGLGGEELGLRDKIIARDAAATQIDMGSRRGVTGGVPGGVDGGVVGSKQDAGRFQGGREGGVYGGTGNTLGANVVKSAAVNPIAAQKPAVKKSMFTITGELKDRQIVKRVLPEYPAWAQAEGIEASVILQFTVDDAGNVKNDVVVRRTSGYPKLDETAIKALRQWKFVPLDENKDEVGQITFNYSLS